MNLKIAICDDEPIIINIIREKLIQFDPKFEIDTYQSGLQLLESDMNYDVIFLDIEMPEMNGMQLASSLREQDFEGYLVFLTSHTEYMPDAFKVRAFRFLQKPILDNDFIETLGDIETDILKNQPIIVPTTHGQKQIRQTDILYLESLKNFTYIHTKDDILETRSTFSSWLDTLGTKHFFRIHKSYAVALRYIDSITLNEIIVKFTNEKIPVSRRNFPETKRAFFNYVKKYARPL